MSVSTSSMAASTTTPTPTPTQSVTSNGGGGPSSPLLFFVALGFGVVFTNLWIIVGVKYCFRYNQRNRARLNGDDPDAVDLTAMPRQRRRREKKLMTMDDVNERFPLVKYKVWRSTRAQEGLPTAGGITATPSRPASIKDQLRVSEDEGEKDGVAHTSAAESPDEKSGSSEHAPPELVNETPRKSVDQRPTTAKSTSSQPDTMQKTVTNDEEDGDQIETAIPAEQLPDPGDTCAICLDTIEVDDDIRGLTCGHAFHASCVDPWLTSRRACCPLCKADYYVPKPRPEGETEDFRRRNPRMEELPPTPFTILTTGRGGRRTRTLVVPARFTLGSSPGTNEPRLSRAERRRQQEGNATTTQNAANGGQPPPEHLTWRQRLGGMRLPTIPAMSRTRNGRSSEAGEQPGNSGVPTPAQLEAGMPPVGVAER